MNTFIFFLFFLTFNLNAEQPKTQKHQEIEKSNLISVQENPATFQQKTTLNTDTQVKTNKKENSVSKIKTPQKSDNNLSNKETSAPTESDVTQESSLSTDNREKESAVLPIDNREKESPPQSVQSIDNQAPLPLESNENEESPATQEDNEEEKDFSQPTSYIEKESSPPESNKNKEPPAQKPSFSIELEAEGGLIKKPLSKNQKGFYPDIPYIELSFEYNILSDLQFFTEMEFGSKQNLWETELEQVGLFYRSNRFDLKVGRIPVSLGYSYANSKLFVKPLSFYKLFRANPMDIGLRLDVPLYKEYLNLSISRFKGYLKRSFDNFYKPPEFAPMTISLKGKGPSWNGFITYLKQNLAFQESLHVLGGGFVFKTPTFPGVSTISPRRGMGRQ